MLIKGSLEPLGFSDSFDIIQKERMKEMQEKRCAEGAEAEQFRESAGENTDAGYIEIRGASENNLREVSLRIPKKKITVFTGVSGSGKSSLCLDTIAAASRRELNATFPSFVQQFLPKYGRPKVEHAVILKR